MFANQHFFSSSQVPYKPFHSNNMDFAIGGPIIPHHNSFFYFAVEPLRSSSSAGGARTFPPPRFLKFAAAHFPTSFSNPFFTTPFPPRLCGPLDPHTHPHAFRSLHT